MKNSISGEKRNGKGGPLAIKAPSGEGRRLSQGI